ncbi:WbqC family protein [Kocuria tytonis]|uniref:WbqC family protein n=1 Tax=Kocuria tytonis TaxID=2054280 RepID=A0A495A8Z5_9MICC|nr:WbqC family protein [Kocuria tytonis]RKQ36516.1 hypothetical protein C1C97_002330 [Kocuria tytonis]
MRVTIHQPDLLPYSGFWYKMAVSDAFVVSRHDQFQKHGYQRRVRMRDSWASHRLAGKPALVPITEVTVLAGWQERLTGIIEGRYRGAPQWKRRGPEIVERIRGLTGTALDEVNLGMIEMIRDMLGITTPLMFTDPPRRTATDRLIEQVTAVGGDEYYAGTGGRSYMVAEPEAYFAAHGLKLTWSDHVPVTGDSVLSLLMDREDPMPAIMNHG